MASGRVWRGGRLGHPGGEADAGRAAAPGAGTRRGA